MSSSKDDQNPIHDARRDDPISIPLVLASMIAGAALWVGLIKLIAWWLA